MPLYECHCEPCALTFEVLAPVTSAGMKSRPCPRCGRPSRRVMSVAGFVVNRATTGAEAGKTSASGKPDVTKLRVPPQARLCWMDDRSAARFAAYKHGRGAEYDDTVAGREELRKQRGEPPEKSPAHAHDHSPLSDPKVLAHRREAAARKIKVAESQSISSHARSPANAADKIPH